MFNISKKDFDALRANHPDYISKAICDHEHNGKTCYPHNDKTGCTQDEKR